MLKSGYRSGMNDTVNTYASGADRSGIANVTAYDLHSECFKFRVNSPSKAAHSITTGDELFADRVAEKPASAGDQCVHRRG